MTSFTHVCILDYGVGNTSSVANALKKLGYNVSISHAFDKIDDASVLIMPGVGAFDFALKEMQKRELIPLLEDQVLKKGKPIMGICLGMQILFSESEEMGLHRGLGWIDGRVDLIPSSTSFPVPHVGWNKLDLNGGDLLYKNLRPNDSFFYFDHSYKVNCDPKYVTAYAQYGDLKIPVSVSKNNIRGVQFHPEKSDKAGMRLFRSFIEEARKM